MWFDNWAKYNNLINKLRVLERLKNENMKKMIDKVQAFGQFTIYIKKTALERLVIDKLQASERFTNKNEKNRQMPVEEYRAKPIVSSH